MPDLHVIQPSKTGALAHEALDGLGCSDYGVAVLQGAKSWGAHETGGISIPGDDLPSFSLSYDEREAPYVTSHPQTELPGRLISLTDEGNYLACFWAQTSRNSPVLGIGIDLASSDDFPDDPGDGRLIRLLFTEHERELAQTICPDNLPFAFATLFGAKEAAFKACARPLRIWYKHHDEELFFDVRHFCMTEPGVERGEARNAAAQKAMERMGIQRISIHYAEIETMSLVVAIALGQPENQELIHD